MLQRSILLHFAHLSSIACVRGIPVHGEKLPCGGEEEDFM